MSIRMVRTNVRLFIDKVTMKYITHEMVNEDIFPLGEEPQPYKKVTKEEAYRLIERLG